MSDAADVARRCAEVMYAADVATRHLGITLEEVRPGYALARMRVTDTMVQGHGSCHGGYLFLLADSAFAFACNSYGARTVAAGCDIVFVTAAKAGDDLVAEASERTRVGRSGVYDVTVRKADGTVVAEFRGRSRTVSGWLLDELAPGALADFQPAGTPPSGPAAATAG